MHSLRTRLILSHILPVLIVIPLIALAVYLLLLMQSNLTDVESAILQQTEELRDQAELLAEASGQIEEIWRDPAFASGFITGIDLELTSVSFYDAAGNVLASDSSDRAATLNELLTSEEVGAILSGQETLKVIIRDESATQIADAFIPVFDINNRLTGALRLSRELANVQERFRNLTYILLAVTGLLLALGIGIGLWLALRLEHALTQVTDAIYGIAVGEPPRDLPSQDIAEIHRLYSAVNTLVDRLATLEETRRRLLANLVHELGRPLGSMRAAVQALEHGAADSPALRTELLTGIDQQIERMQPLLEDLTELHGQVLGSLELNLRPTLLTPWLQELSTLWREAAVQKGLTWRADIPLDLPALMLDSDKMSRAVGNLLSNAIKFTSAGGTVVLAAGTGSNTAVTSPAAVWIHVRDDGPGVDPADQALIFEPFKRGEANRRFPQGMGLGLAIAQDIVHAHGGRIELHSQPGEGAVFTVVLPWDQH